jgi:membrane protease YdiL (CAAX protease family)
MIRNLSSNRVHNSRQLTDSFESSQGWNTSVTGIFLIRKLKGFILFGWIPGIIVFTFFPISPADVGLSFGLNKVYWYLFGIPFIIVCINYFLANNAATFSRYPQMRFSEWTKTRLAVTAFGWTIYLFGYEFLFRGLLFFSVYHSYGLFASLAVNVIIYSAAHIPKGRAEMIGAIPFGLLLCSMSLLTNSIILPFLIHLSLALSTDFFSIHYNPDMKLVKSLKSSQS